MHNTGIPEALAGPALTEATFELQADAYAPDETAGRNVNNRDARRKPAKAKTGNHRSGPKDTEPKPPKGPAHKSSSSAEGHRPRPSQAGTARGLLQTMLRFSVPLQIFEIRNRSTEELQRLAQEASQMVASHGDDLMFGGKHCAETFNSLATGLAAAALILPGGVDWMEMHFCTQGHEGCPHARGKER